MKQRSLKEPKGKMNLDKNKLPNSRLRQGHSAMPNPVNTVGQPNPKAKRIARIILYVLFALVLAFTVAFFVFAIVQYIHG